jgi:Flp pilus assembly protein TadD
MIRLGDDMRRSGDLAGALEIYRSAERSDPHDAVPLERMGETLLALDDAPRAEQAFRAALTLASGDANARRGLAQALLAEHHAEEALPILRELAAGSPDPRMFRAYGTALDLTGQPEAAQQVYRQGLQIAPADADLHGNLALSLAISGDTHGALQQMRAAIDAPDPDPRQEANAVLIMALAGQADTARERGDRALGAAATDVLLGRAAQARGATDARGRALALGVITATPTAVPGEPLPMGPATAGPSMPPRLAAFPNPSPAPPPAAAR